MGLPEWGQDRLPPLGIDACAQGLAGASPALTLLPRHCSPLAVGGACASGAGGRGEAGSGVGDAGRTGPPASEQAARTRERERVGATPRSTLTGKFIVSI